jgi:hypothetical protein
VLQHVNKEQREAIKVGPPASCAARLT